MATIEVHVKESNYFNTVQMNDILTTRTRTLAHIIFDSPELTVRIRLTELEFVAVAEKLMTRPNL